MSQQRISDKLPYAFGLLGTVFLVYWYSKDLCLPRCLSAPLPGLPVPVSCFHVFLRSGGSAGMKAGMLEAGHDSSAPPAQSECAASMVFSITIMSLLILTLLRTDLINEWQAQLPEDTPNHFMMNITRNQIAGIQEFLMAMNSEQCVLPADQCSCDAVNGDEPDPEGSLDDEDQGSLTDSANLADVELGSEAGSALELNAVPEPDAALDKGRRVRGCLSRRQVTWADDVPPDNLITAGQWWGDNPEPLCFYRTRLRSGSISAWVIGLSLKSINKRYLLRQLSQCALGQYAAEFFIIFSPGTIDHLEVPSFPRH